jgi:phage shock protein PspC (stress-responsive transcriptional regulator)
MSLADELNKLEDLRARGVLSDEEFGRAKQRLLDGSGMPLPGAAPAVAAVNSFRRSLTDKWLGGVCGGLARATGLESWVWRLIVVILALFGGTGVLLYLLLWIFVPAE